MAKEDSIVIALAGNPNCGKTSLFNFITGSRQHVGNYPGVTVERKEGTVPVDDARITFVDLPGTYSLSPFSLEEYVARHEILSPRISGIIIVVDTTRLERNLYLASQIIEMGKPVVLALNMYDEFEKSENQLDIDYLSKLIGIPCVKTIGNRGKGVTELMSTALKAVREEIPALGKSPVYSHDMEHAIDSVMELTEGITPHNLRWTAVNLLIFGKSTGKRSSKHFFSEDIYQKVDTIRQKLEDIEGRSIQGIVTAGRYGYASGALAECLKEREHSPQTTSDKIDAVLTNKLLGFPIFLFILWSMFQMTFKLGEIPMGWIENLFGLVSTLAEMILPDGMIESLIVDGIIAGVGGVIVFLPNILILFFFISLLEDTGYMARTAFIMDRVMHLFGLHGKSFLPMLVGFGCTVPAIMATRILENRRDRIVTMFVVPFMSCGARLPVYILLAGAFFKPGQAGNIIFSVYIVGILLSFSIAKILSFGKGTSTPFVMELPPYRMPTMRSVFLHIWERAYMYIRKAGTVILIASVIVWFMVTFPNQQSGGDTEKASAPNIEHTYAGQFGKLIEPALRPLGFDWRVGVALSTGFAAKEVIVATLATTYSVNRNNNNEEISLKQALRNDPNLNPIKAYGLMLFILIYVPCLAVLAVLKREAGGWKWVGLMTVYTISIAWIVSFAFIKTAEFIFS